MYTCAHIGAHMCTRVYITVLFSWLVPSHVSVLNSSLDCVLHEAARCPFGCNPPVRSNPFPTWLWLVHALRAGRSPGISILSHNVEEWMVAEALESSRLPDPWSFAALGCSCEPSCIIKAFASFSLFKLMKTSFSCFDPEMSTVWP